MKVVNSEVEPGEAPVVNSRYSIVMATSKRARQLISGEDALVHSVGKKPLSTAVEELNQGKIKILTEEDARKSRAKAELVIDLGDMGDEDNDDLTKDDTNVSEEQALDNNGDATE
jgi:DNA-directed RNA polymerase subunit omega